MLGGTSGACTKAPLFTPSARQQHREKLSFQQKIKQASKPRLARFHVAEGGPLSGAAHPGALSCPRSQRASRRRRQQPGWRREPECTRCCSAKGHTGHSPGDRMPLPQVTHEEVEAGRQLPGPLRKACSGIASLGRTGPPCFGKGMISVGGGSGRPDWHQGVSVCLGVNPRRAGGYLRNQSAALTCLPGPSPAWHPKLLVSVFTVSKAGGSSLCQQTPAPAPIIAPEKARPAPEEGVPGRAPLGGAGPAGLGHRSHQEPGKSRQVGATPESPDWGQRDLRSPRGSESKACLWRSLWPLCGGPCTRKLRPSASLPDGGAREGRA